MNINEWFDSLPQDTIEAEGERLLKMEEEWHDRVPEHMDRAAERAMDRSQDTLLAGLLLPLALKPRSRGAAKPLSAAKIAAIALAGTVTVTAGVYAASPTLRQELTQLLAPTVQTVETQPGQKTDAEEQVFQIISPGEEYSIVEQGEGDNVRYCWFASDRGAILVEVLFYMPERTPGETETVIVGGLPGSFTDTGSTRILVLESEENYLVIQASGAEREEILSYAEQLIAANRS